MLVSVRKILMYQLRLENRREVSEPFVTRAEVLVIGRAAECQFRLADNGVSDRHATIERRPDGYYIRDCGTANGVRINGQVAALQRLNSGDEIELGAARLRFEVVHQPGSGSRRFDLLQLVAVLCVTLIIIGQVAVFAWIFREPRPRNLRVAAGRMPVALEAAPNASESPAPPSEPEITPPSMSPTQRPAPASEPISTPAPVLPRMIRVLAVERMDTTEGVNLKIRVLAQVSDRDLDLPAVRIGVQLFTAAGSGQPPVGANPQWLRIPAWENFTSTTFLVRFPAPPAQFAGLIVRTYYRDQPQDEYAEPSALANPTQQPNR